MTALGWLVALVVTGLWARRERRYRAMRLASKNAERNLRDSQRLSAAAFTLSKGQR